LKVWGAACQGSGDSFGEVVTGHEAQLLVSLMGDHRGEGVEEFASHGGADGGYGQWGRGGEFMGQGPCSGAWVLIESVTQADLERFVAVHSATGREKVEGALTSDHMGESDGDAKPLMKAKTGEVGAEPGGRGGHPEVAGQCKTEATSDG
jgi:hypothetical protein